MTFSLQGRFDLSFVFVAFVADKGQQWSVQAFLLVIINCNFTQPDMANLHAHSLPPFQEGQNFQFTLAEKNWIDMFG